MGGTGKSRTGVCILEADFTGHRLHYLRHLTEAAGADRSVVLTTDQAVQSDEYRAHEGSMIPPPVIVLPDSSSRRALLAAAIAYASVSEARMLVIPEGDFYLLDTLLYLLRNPRQTLQLRLLLMRTASWGGPERLRVAMIVKPVLAQLLRLFRRVRVLFLTDAFGVVARRRGFPGLQPVRDPIAPVERCNERPSWFPPADPATTVIGVFGVISSRKNLPLLVSAVAEVPSAVLVVGGRFEPDVRQYLQSDAGAVALTARGGVIVADRVLDADEFAAGLAAADVVAVLHDNDSPSGILAEACVRRTPALVPEGGWLARVVESTGIGASVAMTTAGVAAGIRRSIQHRDGHLDAMRQQGPNIGTIDFVSRLLH